MTSALCTLAIGPHRELFEIARPTFEAFAVRHGRDLVVGEDDVAGGRHPGWGKVALLRELLDAYGTVVWVDADAVVVDGRDDMAAAVRPWQDLGLVTHRYGGLEVPNFGVFVLRASRWSRRLVDRLWQDRRYVDHPWWENAALLDILGYDVGDPRPATRRRTVDSLRVGRLDLSWNSIPLDPAPRPRICHFPGMEHGDRLALMRAALG
ncbi:MAG TPA: hypothetical protein VFA94_04600 [Acidimicrobiales bacterium]|nr:hypothetical protein [Acidimicrobiales bacterium]